MLDIAHIKVMASSGCTVQQIAAVVEVDLAEGLLARRAAGRQRQRRYMAKLKLQQNQRTTDASLTVTNEKPEQYQHSTDASVTVSNNHHPLPPCPPLDKENTPTPLKEINPPLNPPTPISVEPRNLHFEQFWQAYPNQVGKKVAAKAFALAQRRASFEHIFAGLSRYVAKTDDRPWCNPSTWLNQDRWEDQPATVQRLAKPLTFREANILRNQQIINQSCGRGHLNGNITPIRSSYENPPQNHPQERRQLGPPAFRPVPEPDLDDFNF